MPFCARCLGSAVGHVASLLLFFVGHLPNPVLSILFIGVLGIDWSLQNWLGIMSTNPRRLVTGIV